jgi:hypothetical protein
MVPCRLGNLGQINYGAKLGLAWVLGRSFWFSERIMSNSSPNFGLVIIRTFSKPFQSGIKNVMLWALDWQRGMLSTCESFDLYSLEGGEEREVYCGAES